LIQWDRCNIVSKRRGSTGKWKFTLIPLLAKAMTFLSSEWSSKSLTCLLVSRRQTLHTL
jgi:hypothetical protein